MVQMAAWVHNSSYHRALKASPYEVVTGMKPNQARMWLPGESEKISEDEIHQYFGVRKEQLEKIRERAIEAIQSMQNDFLEIQNKRLRPHVFRVGQQVLIRRHMKGSSEQWNPSYYGPFLVTKIVNESVLEIEDPASGNRDTIHVQYVKPYYSLDEFDKGIEETQQQFPQDSENTEEDILSPTYYPDDPESQIILEQEQKEIPAPSKPDSPPQQTKHAPSVDKSPVKSSAPAPRAEEQKKAEEPKTFLKKLTVRVKDFMKGQKETPAVPPSVPTVPKPSVEPLAAKKEEPVQPRVKFSTEIVTTQPPPKTPPRNEIRPPAALPSTACRKRMNADEQVIQDQWLANQTSPDAPPFVADPQVTTRSARKKERAKTPRVIATKGKATPMKRKIPKPSALPVPPGKIKLDPVATSIRKKTTEAPQKTPTQLEVENEEEKKKKKKIAARPQYSRPNLKETVTQARNKVS
jgi:hypothetical protein